MLIEIWNLTFLFTNEQGKKCNQTILTPIEDPLAELMGLLAPELVVGLGKAPTHNGDAIYWP